MDLQHPDPDSVPVRDAATVMLLRDGAVGMEVCMLLRNFSHLWAFTSISISATPKDTPNLATARAGNRTQSE